jgi:hypothetical protein
MEGVQQFIQNEYERLKRINVDKVYYRHLMASPEIWITFKDKDYDERVGSDYDYFIDEFTKLGVDPSVTPIQDWSLMGSEKWGWKELKLN